MVNIPPSESANRLDCLRIHLIVSAGAAVLVGLMNSWTNCTHSSKIRTEEFSSVRNMWKKWKHHYPLMICRGAFRLLQCVIYYLGWYAFLTTYSSQVSFISSLNRMQWHECVKHRDSILVSFIVTITFFLQNISKLRKKEIVRRSVQCLSWCFLYQESSPELTYCLSLDVF